MYIKFSKGIDKNQVNGKTRVLKLIKNLYRQKLAGCIWNIDINEKLLTLGFEQSSVDKCVLLWGWTLFTCYMDYGILDGPYKN